jgi:hypothetical protein
VTQHTKVCQFPYVIVLILTYITIFIADYRKWEATRTEPIRHDGGYVSLYYLILYCSLYFL